MDVKKVLWLIFSLFLSQLNLRLKYRYCVGPERFIELKNELIDELINKLIDELIDALVNELVDELINELIGELINIYR